MVPSQRGFRLCDSARWMTQPVIGQLQARTLFQCRHHTNGIYIVPKLQKNCYMNL